VTRIVPARLLLGAAVFAAVGGMAATAADLPAGFVYLADVAPTIRQDIRYAASHNFTGRPVAGYQAGECILTARAAGALQQVQTELARRDLSLIVWDCYRPARAVRDFVNWTRSRQPSMKAEFFPRTDKDRLFALGYLSPRSAHSRGSTVDLGLVPAGLPAPPRFDAASPLAPCTAPKGVRFDDGTVDLGTGYDCLDPLASTNNPGVSKDAHDNRVLLKDIMQKHGFKAYLREWWHFELIDAPFKGRSFDFPVAAPAIRGKRCRHVLTHMASQCRIETASPDYGRRAPFIRATGTRRADDVALPHTTAAIIFPTFSNTSPIWSSLMISGGVTMSVSPAMRSRMPSS
jgi:D-alanyl-D-alanine dipeptidase